jgi:hypothetical protein
VGTHADEHCSGIGHLLCSEVFSSLHAPTTLLRGGLSTKVRWCKSSAGKADKLRLCTLLLSGVCSFSMSCQAAAQRRAELDVTQLCRILGEIGVTDDQAVPILDFDFDEFMHDLSHPRAKNIVGYGQQATTSLEPGVDARSSWLHYLHASQAYWPCRQCSNTHRLYIRSKTC